MVRGCMSHPDSLCGWKHLSPKQVHLQVWTHDCRVHSKLKSRLNLMSPPKKPIFVMRFDLTLRRTNPEEPSTYSIIENKFR